MMQMKDKKLLDLEPTDVKCFLGFPTVIDIKIYLFRTVSIHSAEGGHWENFRIFKTGNKSKGLTNCINYAYGDKPTKEFKGWGRDWDLRICDDVPPCSQMLFENILYSAEDAMGTFDLAECLHHVFTFKNYYSRFGSDMRPPVKNYPDNWFSNYQRIKAYRHFQPPKTISC